MIHAYDKRILDTAMECLGEAYDYACNDLGIDIDLFSYYFVRYGMSKEFERGNSKYICGMSGTELALKTIPAAILNNKTKIDPASDYNASKEYWVGWVLAYHQWLTGRPFHITFEIISAKEILGMYNPYHTASEDRFVVELEKIIKLRRPETNLQYHRKINELSQSQLAEASGVNIRTIQQYEIGAKNINNASISAVIALSRALHCSIEDILEYSYTL